MIKHTNLLALAACLAVAPISARSQSIWSGAGNTPNWSNPDNWVGGFGPGPFSGARFSDFAGEPGQLTNIINSSLTIPDLTYAALASPFATWIPDGVTLTLQGLWDGATVLRAGTDAAAAGDAQVRASISGGGSLLATLATGNISIRQTSADYGDHRATLDLSGLHTFTASVGNLWVGVDAVQDGAFGTLKLARTNTITTAPNLDAPGILLGRGRDYQAAGTVELGYVNRFNTDGLVVGGAHSSGYPNSSLRFAEDLSQPSLALRGSAGGATRADLFAIGDATATESGYDNGPEGGAPGAETLADLTGGEVDLRVNRLVVGRSAPGEGFGFGWAYGTLRVDRGVVDANEVWIGQDSGENWTSAFGKVEVQGSAVLDIQGDLHLAHRPGPENYAPLGTLTVADQARVNVRGNILDGGGVSRLRLDGGVVDLQPAGDATPGNVSLDELVGGGTITNAADIFVQRQLLIGTEWTAATLGLDGNLFLGPYLTVPINLGPDQTPGVGNDFVAVGGNLALDQTTFMPVFTGPLTPGTYHLMDYAGTLSGEAEFANSTRLTLTLDTGTPNHVDLIVSGAPGNLVWSGIGGNDWNTFAPLWNGDTETFYTLDNVTFDDSGAATTVAINGTVEPGSITVSGNQNYRLEGWGSITGFTGITNHGPGNLTLAVGGDYRGPVWIAGGTLSAARWGALGATNGATYVLAGAALDLAGQFMNDPEPVFIAGNGPAGQGAVINSGGNSLFALRDLTLTADASVNAAAGANWGIADSTPLFGPVDLAGHTLTKLGDGTLTFYNCRATNSGNLVIAAGALRVTDSIIAGAGTLDLGANVLRFQNNQPTGSVAKALSVNGGRIEVAGEASFVAAPVTLAGPLTVDLESSLQMTAALDGPGSLTIRGGGELRLEAANGFTGPTLVEAGALALGPSATLAGTSGLEVRPDAIWDVTARASGYALSAGQGLNLEGTLSGDLVATAANPISAAGRFVGALTVGGGSTMIVGGDGATRTVTVADDLTLDGAELSFELTASNQPGEGVNDLVAVGGNLNLSGVNTLVLRPVGILSGTYTLFTYDGLLNGGALNLALATPSRYTFTLVDPATTPGEIRVQVSGSAASLVWQGGAAGAPTVWDLRTTTNWLHGGTPAVFFEGDLTTFNDAAITNRATLVGQLRPAVITLANATRAITFDGAGGLFAGSLTNLGAAGLTFANTADNTFTGAGLALQSGTVTFAQPANTTLRSRFSGPATLAKAGPSTLTVTSPDSMDFTGTTALQAGTLRLGSENALGRSSVTLTAGARLDLNGHTAEAAAVHARGDGPDGSGAINNFGSEQTLALTNVVLEANTTLGAAAERWDIGPGVLQGNAHTLAKAGAGQLWIRSGSDLGVGDVDIREGTLVVAGEGTTLGDPSRSIVVRSNASLGFGGDIEAGTKPALLLPGASLYGVNTGSRYEGAVTLSNGLVRLESLAELELAGPLQGPATLRQTAASFGGGRLTLSGTNTFTGGAEVNHGVLAIARATALPGNSTVVLTNTGQPFSGDFPVLELGTNVISPATTTLRMHSDGWNGLYSMVAGGEATWSGPVELVGDGQFLIEGFGGVLTFAGPFETSAAAGTVSVRGYDTEVVLEQPLRFGGELEMGSLGLGALADVWTTLTLKSAGNEWDSTWLVRGRLNLGADNALPLAPILVGTLAGIDHRVIVDLAGHQQTIVSLQEMFLGNDPITIGNSSSTADATLTYDGFGLTETTARIVDALDFGFHRTALTVNGGWLQLYGTNSYTGPTRVQDGTLLVSRYDGPFGNLGYLGQLGFTTVTVADGGTLGGDGLIYGTVTIEAGGTLAPGNPVGALTLATTLTLAPGARCVFEVDLAAGTNDLVTGLMAVTLDGTLEIQALGSEPFTDGTVLKLFDAFNYTAGTVTVEPPTPGPGLAWDTALLAVDGTLRVVAAPVPPTITNFGFLPDGAFALTLAGEVGQPYTILASTNVAQPLAEWTVLETGTLPSSPHTFTDPGATNQPVRFYLTTTP